MYRFPANPHSATEQQRAYELQAAPGGHHPFVLREYSIYLPPPRNNIGAQQLLASVLGRRELCTVLCFLNRKNTRKLESLDPERPVGFMGGRQGFF